MPFNPQRLTASPWLLVKWIAFNRRRIAWVAVLVIVVLTAGAAVYVDRVFFAFSKST